MEISRYVLHSATALNSRSARREHEGFLIRLHGGFGCVHPWPELGDQSVEDQLNILRQGGTTPLLDSAIRCAQEDGNARREHRSLFIDPIPESHWFYLQGDDPMTALAAGFREVKMKLGDDLAGVLSEAIRWAEAGFRLRFDANESLSQKTFFEFWEDLRDVRANVDFVEDPTPWELENWRILHEAGVPLAVDHYVAERWKSGEIAVLKPANSSWTPPDGTRVVVTSTMDHALGQAWAALSAARLRAAGRHTVLSCGLLTHRCFQADPFFDQIRTEGPRLLAPSGTGLGFNDVLDSLPWTPLI
jgi:o-succinylbenzoate synthase